MATQDKPIKGSKYGELTEKRGVTGEIDTDIEKGDGDEGDSEVGREWDESAIESEDEPVINVELDDDGNIKQSDKDTKMN